MNETSKYLFVIDGGDQIRSLKKIVTDNPKVFTEKNFFSYEGYENFKQIRFIEKQMAPMLMDCYGTLCVEGWASDDNKTSEEMSIFIKNLEAKGFANFDSFAENSCCRVKMSEFMNADLEKLGGIYFLLEEK